MGRTGIVNCPQHPDRVAKCYHPYRGPDLCCEECLSEAQAEARAVMPGPKTLAEIQLADSKYYGQRDKRDNDSVL
jgi:hypothetical protein